MTDERDFRAEIRVEPAAVQGYRLAVSSVLLRYRCHIYGFWAEDPSAGKGKVKVFQKL